MNQLKKITTPELLDVFNTTSKDVNDIIPGVLKEKEVLMISGDTGIGKSILAQQLALSIATSTTFPKLGASDPYYLFGTKNKKVIFFNFENDLSYVKSRYNKQIKGLDTNDYGLKHTINTLNNNLVFIHDTSFEEHWEQIVDFIKKDSTLNGGVLFVDSHYTSTKNDYYRPLKSQIKTLKEKYNMTIVIVSHYKKRVDKKNVFNPKNISGWKRLSSFVDNLLLMHRPSIEKDIKVYIERTNTQYKMYLDDKNLHFYIKHKSK